MYRAASGARLRQCTRTRLPALDLRALARRAALPAALAVVAVTVFVLAGGPLQAFADALDRAIDADPRWVGRRRGLRAAVLRRLRGAAVARGPPRHAAAGTARERRGHARRRRGHAPAAHGRRRAARRSTIWAFRRAGLDTRGATRTLLAFLFVLYSVFLASIAVAGGLLTLGLAPGGALALTALPAIGACWPSAPRWCSPPPPGGSAASALRRAGPSPAALTPRHGGPGGARRDRARALRRSAPARRGRPGGRSTRPCCGRCCTRWARPRRSPCWCSPTSSARSPTRSPCPAPRAAAWSACCWPSAWRRTSRSARCSPTARWRSGCPRRSAWSPSAACAAPFARWAQEDGTPAADPAASHRPPGADASGRADAGGAA